MRPARRTQSSTTAQRRSSPAPVQSLLSLALSALLAVTLLGQTANAQGGFFQHFFNAGQASGEAHEQEAPPSGDSRWWNERVDAATCIRYLCPRTLSCVDKPANCPCPFPEQIRCPYADGESKSMDLGGHTCVSEKDCNRVALMRSLGSNFKLSDLPQR
ncbi:hypothetical protein K437DRAFT_237435 [Tilletiaria anomala UBC 951]|uniref:Long chronological lifespan protein 2 n=1 Tax=Tilletiaria anomala (strain ATCC 24038 / CBS 436.72 / UBC 951) TaxID=1037660 RepID=A0A066VWR7_TILAU|nr:uncharacterized protein K437DRAFT_237435 [Tilletiaria anomala UBC 951]KDN42985.1 hypothetical protein K437DRAFT_237435 [Tilletiaria anomala UBC 951]